MLKTMEKSTKNSCFPLLNVTFQIIQQNEFFVARSRTFIRQLVKLDLISSQFASGDQFVYSYNLHTWFCVNLYYFYLIKLFPDQ